MNGLATRRRLRRPYPHHHADCGVVRPIDRIIAGVCIVLLVVILTGQVWGML